MVTLVFFTETFHDFDRVIDRRLVNFDLLETALQCGIFFNVLAILVHGGGSDTLHLRATESGLNNIRSVHCPFRRSRTHDGVKFVDEKDDVFDFANFIHHGLDPLFELTPILSTRHHECQIKGHHFLVPKNFGNIASCNFLGQPFNNRGLTNTRFPNKHRVIFSPATENLNHALDFRSTPNNRIQLTGFCEFGQIATERLKRRSLGLSFGTLGLLFKINVFFSFKFKIFFSIFGRKIGINLR